MAEKKRRKTNAVVDVEPWASELDDIAKLRFSGKAVREGHDFSGEATVPPELAKVLEWLSQRSAEEVCFMFAALLHCCVSPVSLVQVNAYREKAISEIELMAKEMRRSGAAADWANVKDSRLREAAHGVNGPLLVKLLFLAFTLVSVAYAGEYQEFLAKFVAYHDCSCIDMFRVGARLLGELECSGNGRRLKPEEQGKSDLNQLNRGPEKMLVVLM